MNAHKEKAFLTRLLSTIALGLCLTLALPSAPGVDLAGKTAHADDDDGGDGDGDDGAGKGNSGGQGGGKGKGDSKGGGRGGGKSSGIKGGEDSDDDDGDDDGANSKTGGQTTGTSEIDGRDYELREVVAFSLNARTRSLLLRAGFSVIDSASLITLTGKIERLRAPRGLSESEALRLATDTVPSGLFDFNTLYSLRGKEDGCDGRCLAGELLRWEAPTKSCRRDVKIGMIDTAIDKGHPSLIEASINSRQFRSRGRQPSTAEHGTAVASLLVGSSKSGVPGLLPQARLYAADAFHVRGKGERADTLDLVRSLDWLVSEQVAVINMSFAGGPNQLLEQAITETAARGVTLVGAAGDYEQGGGWGFPAAYEPVIAVTAVDRNMRPYRAAARGKHLDFAAPGVGLTLAHSGGGTVVQTGTSYAAPFVSAAFALLRGSKAIGTASQASRRLQASVRDLGPPGRDPVFGWGLVRLPKNIACD